MFDPRSTSPRPTAPPQMLTGPPVRAAHFPVDRHSGQSTKKPRRQHRNVERRGRNREEAVHERTRVDARIITIIPALVHNFPEFSREIPRLVVSLGVVPHGPQIGLWLQHFQALQPVRTLSVSQVRGLVPAVESGSGR